MHYCRIFLDDGSEEELLSSLMVCRALTLCCLYSVRFSEEGFALDFLRATLYSLMSFHSSVSHGFLCFKDILILSIIFFTQENRVLVKCIIGFFFYCFSDYCGKVLLFEGLVVNFLEIPRGGLWIHLRLRVFYFSFLHYYWAVVTVA